MATEKKPERKIVPVHPTRQFPYEAKVRSLLYLVDETTRPDDALDPMYWAHVARELNEFAEVTLISENWTWEARFRVREVGSNWAKVVELYRKDFEQLSPTGSSFVLPGFDIRYAGTFAKWRVIRIADNGVIRDKFVSKADAETWLVEYAKSLAA